MVVMTLPHKHNEGQFEALVPLRNAKFAFQPDWLHEPTLILNWTLLTTVYGSKPMALIWAACARVISPQ